MKQSIPPGAIAVVLVVIVAVAVFLGYRYMNGGADGDVTQARINMYKNARGPIGSSGGSSPGAPSGATSH